MSTEPRRQPAKPRDPACRHSFQTTRAASAVRLLECTGCGEVTLEFDTEAPWSLADQRIIERYYVRRRL